jgi:hypothetical protein
VTLRPRQTGAEVAEVALTALNLSGRVRAATESA